MYIYIYSILNFNITLIVDDRKMTRIRKRILPWDFWPFWPLRFYLGLQVYMVLWLSLNSAITAYLLGVYFEKILKGSQTSLWMRNIQLAVPSIPLALIPVYFSNVIAIILFKL